MGPQFALRILLAVGEMHGASRFIDITWAHVASAYCHTQANIDLADRLLQWNARVSVPTTLTACSYDPNVPGAADARAIALTEAYRTMGCEPVLTCAPYQVRQEPTFGTHIAWCESSAVVYANSVLGARTNRYPEFIDISAAILGRVPETGLHLRENRRATVVFELQDVPPDWYMDDWLFQSLGILVGQRCGHAVPAIQGLPSTTTHDQLRALGSAAASSGSIEMFHAVGLTPEAPTLEAACQSCTPAVTHVVNRSDIERIAAGLGTVGTEPVSAVCVGAPHFSLAEFELLARLLNGRVISPNLKFVASTSAAVVGEMAGKGILDQLRASGVEITTGRCTYYGPLVADLGQHVMTNSAKWAWYAPSNLGIQVSFASLAECVDRACTNG